MREPDKRSNSLLACAFAGIMAAGLAAPVVVAAEQSQADLAKAAQNPIANLISLQLQFLFPK